MSWTYGNRYLSESEKKGNVQECEKYFGSWSLNARAAMYGNMDLESNINPAIYENLTVNVNKGYGLTQWTPASKVQNWLRSNGYSITDGGGQCQRILWELANNQQWIPTIKYPQSFSDFTRSNESVATLTDMWARNYERPYVPTMNLPERIKRANKWYEILFGQEPPEPTEPEEPDFPPEDQMNKRYKSFIILMSRRLYNNGKS